MTHIIKFDGNDIADAVVSREGMYYKFLCKCRLANKAPFNLYLLTNDTSILLGKCPPGGQIVKRINIKDVGQLNFSAVLCDDLLYKVCDRLETDCIKKLPQAYLRQENDSYYIEFKNLG